MTKSAVFLRICLLIFPQWNRFSFRRPGEGRDPVRSIILQSQDRGHPSLDSDFQLDLTSTLASIL